MFDPVQLHGKRIAMVMWATKPDGSDDVAVLAGSADWDGRRLCILREPPDPPFPVLPEWFDRVKPVPEELRKILLDAEYHFSVLVGNMEDAGDRDALVKTGLKWPGGDQK